MNLARDFDFSTSSNAALSLRTIAELVRQEKLKCELSGTSEHGIAITILEPVRRSK